MQRFSFSTADLCSGWSAQNVQLYMGSLKETYADKFSNWEPRVTESKYFSGFSLEAVRARCPAWILLGMHICKLTFQLAMQLHCGPAFGSCWLAGWLSLPGFGKMSMRFCM